MAKPPPVAISQLAAYAADPDGYIARKGGPMSAKGVRYGDRYHDQFGRPNRSRRTPALFVITVIAVLLIFAYVLNGW